MPSIALPLGNKDGSISSLPRKFQRACAIAGLLCPVALFANFPAAGFLPPGGPTWSPEETVEHYRKHKVGVEVASILLVLAGVLYIPFTAALSIQLRRIPNIHPIFSSVQLAAGAAVAVTVLIPGMSLAVVTYRLDRPAEITQAFSDFYWMSFMLAWPLYLAQNFAFAFGILSDDRAKPLFPKRFAAINLIIPLLFIPTFAVHCVKTGPLAWDGAYTFWFIGLCTIVQLNYDATCLLRVIATDAEMDLEADME